MLVALLDVGARPARRAGRRLASARRPPSRAELVAATSSRAPRARDARRRAAGRHARVTRCPLGSRRGDRRRPREPVAARADAACRRRRRSRSTGRSARTVTSPGASIDLAVREGGGRAGARRHGQRRRADDGERRTSARPLRRQRRAGAARAAARRRAGEHPPRRGDRGARKPGVALARAASGERSESAPALCAHPKRRRRS
mgnify:CR=1 FL=1